MAGKFAPAAHSKAIQKVQNNLCHCTRAKKFVQIEKNKICRLSTKTNCKAKTGNPEGKKYGTKQLIPKHVFKYTNPNIKPMGIIFNEKGILLNPKTIAEIHSNIPGFKSAGAGSWANDLRNFNTKTIVNGSTITEKSYYTKLLQSDKYMYDTEIKIKDLRGGNTHYDFNY